MDPPGLATEPDRPRLVYDGDCTFCRYTVEYARTITGDAVEYRRYQEVAAEHPEVSLAEFEASIQLFWGDQRHTGARGAGAHVAGARVAGARVAGARVAGARAAFETLAIGGRTLWLRLYQRVPGLSTLFEHVYRWVSRHRAGCYRLARPLFGKTLGPRTHTQIADLLYRGIALCGLLAFLSWWWQSQALIGEDGILPAAGYLDSIAAVYGWERFYLVPTVFWLGASDLAQQLVCAIGVLATAVGLLGRCRFLAAGIAYICYLSLFHAGQTFMAFQWDILLIECFVLAVVLSRAPTLGVWLARLLLFRFMLLSGAVKLLSGDPAWSNGSALEYHFETQPLPTALAWHADKLSGSLLEWGVYSTFFIELVLPFFVFLPRNPRLLAAAGFVLLELLILLTGNYNFFNLLTLVLCIALFDDHPMQRLRGIGSGRRRWGVALLAAVVTVQGFVVLATTLRSSPPPALLRATAPWLIANRYGLFAVMTTRRDELVIEGSLDGEHWLPYEFRYKPGRLDRAPVWVAPHQPRLDWQMWFAALGSPQQSPWIYDFAYALLEARPSVLALLEDPFEGRRPSYIRARRSTYRFTTRAERDATGDWWVRGPPTEWLSPLRLSVPRITHEPLILEEP